MAIIKAVEVHWNVVEQIVLHICTTHVSTPYTTLIVQYVCRDMHWPWGVSQLSIELDN